MLCVEASKRTLWFLALLQMIYLPLIQAAERYPDDIFKPTAERKAGEGQGPFRRLIVRGAMLIDGSGAPPSGPVDIVIENDRISDIVHVGAMKAMSGNKGRPHGADFEIDLKGAYVMPGIVDTHIHVVPNYVGGATTANAEYAYKLFLAHGITTIRGVPLGPVDWTLNEQERSANNEIVAPRIEAYFIPGHGQGDEHGQFKIKEITTEKEARDWVKYIAKIGGDGVKYVGNEKTDSLLAATLSEAKTKGLGNVIHDFGLYDHQKALDAGLGGVTHIRAVLFPGLLQGHSILPFPVSGNRASEQDNMRNWTSQSKNLATKGSEQWQTLLTKYREKDVDLNPTFAVFSAYTNNMWARNADWHNQYTLPSFMKDFEANRAVHGSMYYDWSTQDEIDAKNVQRIGMDFVNDYKNMGGRVTVGSDAGFAYAAYGFATITELELLQESGFHPLEVIRAATMHGAMALAKPTGKPIEYGVIRKGMLADMLIVDENPLQNLKVLYGTGHRRLNDETGRVEIVGGVNYTVKGGVVYDAKKLLKDVADMVAKAKQ